MEIAKRIVRRWDRTDWILLAMMAVAVVLLAGSLGWPLIERWWHRPRPGRQTPQQFVASAEGGRNGSTAAPIRMDYLLYLPKEPATNNAWPLLVYLHGAGERGNDLERVRRFGPPRLADQGKPLPFIMVSPQCAAGRRWEPDEVLRLIEHICGEWPVDRDRVYLMGFSMGAFGTWRTAAVEPERFAALVPIAGGGDPRQADRLVGLPIWAFHGDADKVVSLESSQEMVDAVTAAGGAPRLTVFERKGHGILDRVCNRQDVWTWLASQRRDRPSKTSR